MENVEFEMVVICGVCRYGNHHKDLVEDLDTLLDQIGCVGTQLPSEGLDVRAEG